MTELTKSTDEPHVMSRSARFGLVLFGVYVVLYGGFIFLAVFGAEAMSRPVVGGVNVAVSYGLLLIVAALVLAIVYMIICRVTEEPPADREEATADPRSSDKSNPHLGTTRRPIEGHSKEARE